MDKAFLRNRAIAGQDTQYLARTIENPLQYTWIVADRSGNNDGVATAYACPDVPLEVVSVLRGKWAICNERGQFLRGSARRDYRRASPRYFASPQAAAHVAEVVAEF